MPVLAQSFGATSNSVAHQVQSPADRERLADWLSPTTPYSSSRWEVSDSAGDERDTIILDFDFVMPDGRPLSAWPEFHFVVKEFAFHVRSHRFSHIDDAEMHIGMVAALMNICHGLAHRGQRSFNGATKAIFEGLIPAFKAGSDGILCASERVRAFLSTRDRAARDGFKEGLPLREGGKAVCSSQLILSLGLPEFCKRLPQVAHLINREAKACGLRVKAALPSEPPVSLGASTTHLLRYLQAIELLWEMRARLGDLGLQEKPFDKSALELSITHGKPSKPTPTPPPELALHLMSHALLWVANYSPALLLLFKDATDRPLEIEQHLAGLPRDGNIGSPWPLSNPTRSSQAGMSANKALKLLAVACFIVLATFSARRRDEILGLRACDYRRDAKGQWSLYSYIQKTLLRRKWIPVPPTVGLAMDVLCQLSASARASTGDDSVFQWISPFRDSDDVSDLFEDYLLDEFAAHIGLPAACEELRDFLARWGGSWHWTAHQFRKFFSVLYFYRYRGATVEVLSQFLCHFNLEMTLRYLLLDPEVEKFFKQQERSFRKRVARGIAAKSVVHGGMTRALQRAAQDYRSELASLNVVDPSSELEAAFIEAHMNRKRLVLRPLPWADCACPDTHEGATQAQCRRDSGSPVSNLDRGPDHAGAKPSICPTCPLSIDNGRMKEHLASEKVDAMATASFAPPGSALAKLLSMKVIAIERIEAEFEADVAIQ